MGAIRKEHHSIPVLFSYHIVVSVRFERQLVIQSRMVSFSCATCRTPSTVSTGKHPYTFRGSLPFMPSWIISATQTSKFFPLFSFGFPMTSSWLNSVPEQAHPNQRNQNKPLCLWMVCTVSGVRRTAVTLQIILFFRKISGSQSAQQQLRSSLWFIQYRRGYLWLLHPKRKALSFFKRRYLLCIYR